MNNKIKKAIINFCLREASYDETEYEETHDMLADVDWSSLNIESLDFQSVYRFKAGGDYFMAHIFENDKLFNGKRAVYLYESVESFSSEAFDSTEMFEIWLTTDMKIEFTGCFRMDVEGNEGTYTAEYRYPISGDFPGEFDVESLLDILLKMYGISKEDKNDAL